ncbi:MAG: hypothetical protein WCK27_25900 [Verrucomicrobiota bacterium]
MKLTGSLLSLLTVTLLGGWLGLGVNGAEPRPPNESELVGSWIGIGPAGIPVYWLSLSWDGTGVLAATDVRSPMTAWKVTSWRCSGGKIAIAYEPTDRQSARISGNGKAETVWMSPVVTLTIKRDDKPDSEKVVVFRSEKELSRLMTELREWLQAYDLATRTNISNRQPDGPANGSQPIRSETNSTSGAAGSRR